MSRIAQSSALEERGPGVMFRVTNGERIYPAFVVRVNGTAKGYLNTCAHVGLTLDKRTGNFFSRDGRYISCAQHGATYEPDTGVCVHGPCKGYALIAVSVIERDDVIELDDDAYQLMEEDSK